MTLLPFQLSSYRSVLFSALVVSLLFCFQPHSANALDTTQYPEVGQELRNKIALSKLKDEPNAVAMYVKGFCCPSCGIGVRIKVSRLEFVDQKRFNNGVDFDVEHQLVTVALKSGATPSREALAKAIADAGYEAVHLYTVQDGTLQTEDLPSQE
jgi:hypothetical protein